MFRVAAGIAAVTSPLTTAAIGIASISADVAAHPIEEKASAKVATREEVWRRRNWLRFACTRNQSWIAAADTVATSTPTAVTTARQADAKASAMISRAQVTPIVSNTNSNLPRI